MKTRQHLKFHKPLTPLMAVRVMLDPVLVILTLVATVLILGQSLDRNYILLSLLIFSLTFPGTFSEKSSIEAELKYVLFDWVILVGLLLLFGYVTSFLEHFDQKVVIGWIVATPVIRLSAHALLRQLVTYLRKNDVSRTAVIVGASAVGLQLHQRLRGEATHGVESVGFFDDRPAARTPLAESDSGEILGRFLDLAEYVRQHKIDIIYLALPMSSQPRILQLLDDLKDTTASIYFAPDFFMFDLIQARMDDIAGIPVVAVCETPFHGMNGLIKRTSDLILSVLILTLISPLMIAVAIGVKLSSPGPVLFKQRRYGLDGHEIIVYKFRSMKVCEDGEKVIQARRDDHRVTRLGAVIRRTSIDELPQFINVIQGRMSIVGPRPHAVAHNEEYRKLIKGYMIRHKVKPGITGWAQVNGFRGETETLEKMQMRIDYDLDYLRNWDVYLDLKIILRTVVLVFADRQAY